ncbi:MAG: glycosyltransferase [Candidatus Omnitrophica bacterium]|nr:glycosyltransferase [Candidatus Omnitrophota bacterium]
MDPMKVVHVTTLTHPGAGKCAVAIHVELLRMGVASKVLSLERFSSKRGVVFLNEEKSILRKIQDRIYQHAITSDFNIYRNSISDKNDLFSNDRTIHRLGKHPLIYDADIIHLHWIVRMVDCAELFSHVRDKHIVWTLHDWNPMTGGCHVPRECTKYRTHCGACPFLGFNCQKDLSFKIFERKKSAYKSSHIDIIAPSRAIAEDARQSSLLNGFNIHIINHGISSFWLQRRSKHDSREKLKLPPDKTLILFGAAYYSENKGFSYLLQALNRISNNVKDMGLVIVGPAEYAMDVGKEFPVYNLGYLKDAEMLACAYSSADIFIMPSLGESFGLMALEAMACALPVIGFETGVLTEIIINRQRGIITKMKDVEGLAEAMKYMIDNPKERQQMGNNSREYVLRNNTIEAQADNYLKLYKKILSCENK